MTRDRLLAWRLANQHLAATRTGDPAQVVAHLGAVQAQDYGQSLWAVGQRAAQATVGTVEAAIESGASLRTWPMRGTIHFVPAGDARWMVELLAGRRIKQVTGVYLLNPVMVLDGLAVGLWETDRQPGNGEDRTGTIREDIRPRPRPLPARGGALRGISRPARCGHPGLA